MKGLNHEPEDLLLAAAKAYEEGYNPIEAEWLSRHEVTFEECMDLAEQIAAAIRVWHVAAENGRYGSQGELKAAAGIFISQVIKLAQNTPEQEA